MVIEVKDKNFEKEVLKSALPTEVDFWAPWCSPCRVVSLIYDKLSEEYEGKFKFCKINVDKNPQVAAKHEVISIPMQMFFMNGKKVDQILGTVPEEVIRSKLDELIELTST